MLSIRLSRTGKKNQPTYRLIVLEKAKDPWGDCLEILGYYDPKVGSEIHDLKEDRLKYWLSKGAQPSDTVHNLLINQGILSAEKVRIVKPKKVENKSEEGADEGKKEEPVKEEKPAESAVKEEPAKKEEVAEPKPDESAKS